MRIFLIFLHLYIDFLFFSLKINSFNVAGNFYPIKNKTAIIIETKKVKAYASKNKGEIKIMNYDFERLVLTMLKVITTICLGLILGGMFVQTFAFEICELQMENEFLIAIFATIALMIFYKPLKEAVFGNANFIRYIAKVLVITGIWHTLVFCISVVGYGLTQGLFAIDIDADQFFRMCAILAFFVWYIPYKKNLFNKLNLFSKPKEDIEEVNEKGSNVEKIENEPEPKDQN